MRLRWLTVSILLLAAIASEQVVIHIGVKGDPSVLFGKAIAGRTGSVGNFTDQSAPTMYTVTVLKTGSGAGIVTSNTVNGTAINCGPTCQASFPDRSGLVLVANAGSDSQFKGWHGACSAATGTCECRVHGNLIVIAAFSHGAEKGTYTLTHQPPVTWVPYSANANSISGKKLPGDIMSHLMSNGNTWIKNLIGPAANHAYPQVGYWNSRGQSATNDSSVPFYYSSKDNPQARWYKIGTRYFLAPNNAQYSLQANGGDENIAGWDQTTGILYQFYLWNTSSTHPWTLGSCGCTYAQGTGCACTVNTGSGQATGYPATDKDWGISTSNPSGLAAWVGLDREYELLYGEQNNPATAFNHATELGHYCTGSQVTHVFPTSTTGCICGSSPDCTPTANSNAMPPNGALVFLDYTDAQIASMSLPNWRKALVYQMAHYGGYLDVTGGTPLGLTWGDQLHEGSRAWVYYNQQPAWTGGNDPFLTYMAAHYSGWSVSGGGSAYVFGSDGVDIPRMTCQRGTCPANTDIEGNSCNRGLGCYFSGHIHIAAECVALAYANQPGGCY